MTEHFGFSGCQGTVKTSFDESCFHLGEKDQESSTENF